MMPFSCYLSAGSDGEDSLGDGLIIGIDTTIADEIIGSNICDRLNSSELETKLSGKERRTRILTYSVVTGDTDTVNVTLINTVEIEFLETMVSQ